MSKKIQTAMEHDEELVKGLTDQMKPILDKSEQPIYIYLDDNHKSCNSKFATLLGYKSPEDWAQVNGFLEPFVAEKSQESLQTTFWEANNRMKATTMQLAFKKKSGGTVNATMIMVPVTYQNHLFWIHYVTATS